MKNLATKLTSGVLALVLSAGVAFGFTTILDGIGRGSTTAPALTSCGTSPAITGNDLAGTVTMGTGSPTGCVITFNSAKTAAPNCVVTWRSNIAAMAYTTSTAAITLTQTGTSSNLVDYVCVGL